MNETIQFPASLGFLHDYLFNSGAKFEHVSLGNVQWLLVGYWLNRGAQRRAAKRQYEGAGLRDNNGRSVEVL